MHPATAAISISARNLQRSFRLGRKFRSRMACPFFASQQRKRCLNLGLIALLGITLLACNSKEAEQAHGATPSPTTQATNPFSNLNIALAPTDLSKGTHLVALIDTGCSHCQAAVPGLNQLMVQTKNTPPLIALCANFEADVNLFKKTYQPGFPVGIVARPDLLRLLENDGTPRILLVRDGYTLHVWDGQVPTVPELLQLLPNGLNS